MDRKILLVILIAGGYIAGGVIAGLQRPQYGWWMFWGGLVIAWIYLIWTVAKKQAGIFHSQMEPELAEKRLKLLKRVIKIGGVSLAVFIIGVIVHNVLFAVLDREESISFFIAILGGFLLFLSIIGSLGIYIIGRIKPGKS